jgi:hypothetical protein
MAHDVTIAPRCRYVVTPKLDLANKKDIPSLVCIDPAAVPIQAIFAARAVSTVGGAASDTSQATSHPNPARSVAPANVHIMLTNVSCEELTLPKATVLGVAEEISGKNS